MKKWFVLLMAMALLLTGCAGRPDDTSVSDPPTAPTPDWSFQGEGETAGAPGEGNAPLHDKMVPSSEGDVVEISEKLFIAQTNDIYINTEDYLGKTIRYEGIYKTMDFPGEEPIRYVIRYGPGCCSYDGEAGFEVSWDGEWPQIDDWCEVVGVLEVYEMDGFEYLRLALSSLTVLEERGAEFVSS